MMERLFSTPCFRRGNALQSSQAKLAMRARAYEFKAALIQLAIAENEIRPEVAVAVIAPFAGQWVIEIPTRQRCVGCEQVDDHHQQGVHPGFE
jgi:hypothetical protein